MNHAHPDKQPKIDVSPTVKDDSSRREWTKAPHLSRLPMAGTAEGPSNNNLDGGTIGTMYGS